MGKLKLMNTVRLLHRATSGARLGVPLLMLALSLHAIAGTHLHRPRSTGKEYYIVFPKAAWGNQNVGVLVNAPSEQTISVTDPASKKVDTMHIASRTTKYIGGKFNIVSVPESTYKNTATHIQTSDQTSIVAQYGLNGISGTYTAFPVTAWGKEYYACSVAEGTNQDYYLYPLVYSVPMITIIGSRNGTHVTITPTVRTAREHAASVPFTIVLNAGDVYNITTAGDPQATHRAEDPYEADLTGSHIISDFPTGVIVSDSYYSGSGSFTECGDYGVEWLPPVENWDSVYAVTPVLRHNYYGDALRFVFARDSTVLTVDDGSSGPRVIGTFSTGDRFDYPRYMSSPSVFSATHPFLIMEFTFGGAQCSPVPEGEAQVFSMQFVSGVNQWSDYMPYCTAVGSQSVSNLCFRNSDAPQLKLNGNLLIKQFPTVAHMPQGFATISMSLTAGTFYDVAGDSGASAGGTIFGYGTSGFAPGGNNDSSHVQSPDVVRCFGHPIGGNMTPIHNSDVDAPTFASSFSCGHWTAIISDITGSNATGIFDIWLQHGGSRDSSINVKFTTLPTYTVGDMNVNAGIDVVNLLQPARAHVFVRDGAGNEFDTVLTYSPSIVDALPNLTDVEFVSAGDTVLKSIVLKNRGDSSVMFTAYRLKYGTSWKIIAGKSPVAPFTIAKHDSAVIALRFVSPSASAFVVNVDTLMATTCHESPVCAFIGRNRHAALQTSCFDVGTLLIDTLTNGGDTISTRKNIWVTNSGADTLHILGLRLVGSPPTTMDNGTYPASDYSLGKMFTRDSAMLAMPSPGSATQWSLATRDTVFVEVSAHPHHSGLRNAMLVFDNDGGNRNNDSACLNMIGRRPPLHANNLDFGRALYASAKDSFFVVTNTGTEPLIVFRVPLAHGAGYGTGYFAEFFQPHSYTDTISHTTISYDPTIDHIVNVGDSILIPYSFLASNDYGYASGTPVDFYLNSSSGLLDIVRLSGEVMQPSIAVKGACPPDSVNIGDTLTATVTVWNQGDDALGIDTIRIGGVGAGDWRLLKVELQHGSQRSVQAPGVIWLAEDGASARDIAFITVQCIASSTTIPATVISFTGIDRLGRHSKDSVNSFYGFFEQPFPYDQTVKIYGPPCITGVVDERVSFPSQPILWPSYPNPFSATTALRFTLQSQAQITLRITNVLGETIAVIANGHREAGTYVLPWNAAGVMPGVYFCELMVGGSRVVGKVVKY